MKPTDIRPTGVETIIADNEIIVSKTDTRGIIQYANDVFMRVAKYDESDVIGQPHNMIRHPDMPRTIFKLLWDTIGSGQEIFAYVKNMTADGGHYWVLAHVTPTTVDGRIVGYHSNRRSPNRTALAKVQPLYEAILNEERRQSRPQDAITAGTQVLLNAIADSGFPTYDEWVWSLEPELEVVR
jgi:PAS domain S-box-containing protein